MPASRKDWAEVFADGLDLHFARRAEAEAKAKAEGKKNEGDGTGDTSPKRSWAERILGGVTG